MGKFLQVDPMADKYASATTYNYAFNNPVVLNDPSGADPDEGDEWVPRLKDWYIKDAETGKWNYLDTQVIGYRYEEVEYVNLFISFIPGTKEGKIGDWDVEEADGIGAAINIIKGYKAKGLKIKNIAFLGHGDEKGIWLGGDPITVGRVLDAEKYDPYVRPQYEFDFNHFNKFKSMLEDVEAGGNIVFLHCLAGTYLGPLLEGRLRQDVNIFFRDDLFITKDEDGDYSKAFDVELRGANGFEFQWRNITTRETLRTLILNSAGGVTPFPK